jgi:hypothetical protein
MLRLGKQIRLNDAELQRYFLLTGRPVGHIKIANDLIAILDAQITRYTGNLVQDRLMRRLFTL